MWISTENILQEVMVKTTNPLVSVVIPCFNSKDIVLPCLKSVLATRYPNIEIVVVDDQSIDGTYELLVDKYEKNKKVTLVRNDKNSGPSYTRNHGIMNSKGRYIAFIETDMRVDRTWLDPLVQRMEKDKSLGAVQSKVLDYIKKDYIQAVGVRYDPHTFWVMSIGAGQHKDTIKESQEVSIGAVGSLVRKSVLDEIGGFDEKLVHNIDDIDLGWRIWIAGWKIVTVPQSVTYHWTGKPSKVREKLTSSVKSEFYFHKTPRVFIKNYEAKNVVKYLPVLLAVYLIRDLKCVASGNINPIKGLAKAVFWSIINLADTLRERSRIQSLRKISDSEIIDKVGLKGNVFEVYYRYIKPTYLKVLKVFN